MDARGGIPIPRALTLEEQVEHSRWIFTGILRRVVYVAASLEKKLFTPGAPIKPAELKVYEQHELSDTKTEFFDVEGARPLMRKIDVPNDEAASISRGDIYIRSGGPRIPEYRAAISALMGKQVILFIHAEEKQFGVHQDLLFPKPLFDAGIEASQLWWCKTGNNLEVSVIGSADKVTISNWYLGSARRVEVFELANGQQLLGTQVKALVPAMASVSPPSAGQTSLPANYQSSLDPVLAANWH